MNGDVICHAGPIHQWLWFPGLQSGVRQGHFR